MTSWAWVDVWPKLKLAILLAAMVLFSACTHQQAAEASPPRPTPATPNSAPADSGSAPSINSARAWKYVKETIAFGPRPIGSANHKKLEAYITSHLKGDE